MTDQTDRQPNDLRPQAQRGEDKGTIKRPQQTDATMAEKDLPRGSEPEAHARRG